MKKTVGIFAHVDSGKTTFSERILYDTGSFRVFGRTDKKTSALDTDETEKSRGITVFSHQAKFVYGKNTYYLTDTPGHIDFSPETERSMSVLDYAVLLTDGGNIKSHTRTLFRLLEGYGIPCFIFINKTDKEGFDLKAALESIKNSLSEDCFLVSDSFYDMAEYAAERDYDFLEKYIEGDYGEEDVRDSLKELIKTRKIFPVMAGSALKNIGIDKFLKVFDSLTYTEYENRENDSFRGKVFKVRFDENGKKIIFLKIEKGSLIIKQEFSFGENTEKINEIRIYNGDKFSETKRAVAGDIVGVCGLYTPVCGDVIEKFDKITGHSLKSGSVLEAKVIILDGTDINRVGEIFTALEREEPTLSVSAEKDGIVINTTGKIQLEVLEKILENRFGVKITFGKPDIKYKETIERTVLGFGHYEPLRHYAEVCLRLEPAERGAGISFKSECKTEELPINYQRLIRTHIFEKQHKGVLTGSPITDIRFVLVKGLYHLKHTEGGDFREAVYRGVRQGLMKAESVLLEPFYEFEIIVPSDCVGRILSDIQKMRGELKSQEVRDRECIIKGRGPVETFMDYTAEIASFTKGEGSISLVYGGMDRCMRAQEVIEERGYKPTADTENTPNSVFCKKGAGFNVNWYEVEEYAHTLRK